MKVTELAATLVALTEQLTKAQGEIIARIDALELALKDTPIPDEAIAALEALKQRAQALDDLTPDAPV